MRHGEYYGTFSDKSYLAGVALQSRYKLLDVAGDVANCRTNRIDKSVPPE